ncbi:MAG: TetR/AcrR family transcriptional regulator [Bacteroidales bacterium]|nr:TetR/AcrR family transcriptional regulator [Bacteroidales bacterium]
MKEGKTRKSILEVAKALFDKFGYDKTSMNDIALHSHKAKGSLYYNFNSKIDIYKELIEQELDNIRTKLQEKCRLQELHESNRQISQYLLERMELFNQTVMLKQTLSAQYFGTNHEIVTITKEIRKKFDQWEWNYFYGICQKGKENKILGNEIKPSVFADMFQMLLKGLEVQFFAKDSYKESRKTYEAMVNFILKNMTISN